MSERVTAWLLVGVQVVLLVAVVLVPEREDWPDLGVVATVLLAAGLLLGLWAITVFGRGVTPSPLPAEIPEQGRWLRQVVTGFFAYKARWEEHRLTARYPGYAEYATRVGRFLPGVGRIGAS